MEQWKTYTLEELTIGKGTYGIGASAVPYDSSKYTYLRITDINDDGTLNKNELKSVDDVNADKYVLQVNDIVFARTGNSTGRSYFYDGSDGVLVYAGFLIKFSLDPAKVNPRIMKYYTHSQEYYDWVKSFDTGGTRGNINAKTYGSMPITLPPRDIQDKIVEVLKSLDEKIELNKRINDNLEQQASFLFQDWLSNCNSNVSIRELAENVLDYTQNKCEQVYLLNSSDVTEGRFSSHPLVSNTNLKGQFKKRFKKGDILYSEIRPRNRHYAYCYFDADRYIASTRLIILRAKPDMLTSSTVLYQYLMLNSVFEEFTLKTESRSGTFPQGNYEDLSSIRVPYSANQEEIAKLLEAIYEQLWNNLKENERLEALRNSLVPKLMSGELIINEIDC